MRKTLEKVWKENKSVRKGELVTFVGVHGGKFRNDAFHPLILDITSLDYLIIHEDHIWLSSYNLPPDFRKKISKGRKVMFTATIKPYKCHSNYGVVPTDKSKFIFLD